MAKGKDFEREVSKMISLWLTNGYDEDAIWYTKSSGGRATRRVKQEQYSKQYDFGDLGPDDPKVNYFFDIFNCELKTGYGKKGKKQTTLWSILDIVDSKQTTPLFYDFWFQSVHDAEESNREPILIFRRNRRSACIAMHHHIFKCFMNIGIGIPEFDSITVNYADIIPTVTICNLHNLIHYTWGKVNESFIKLRIVRTILLYERGHLYEK